MGEREKERERERVGERETEVRDVFIILTPQASFLEQFVILKNLLKTRKKPKKN